MRSASSPLSGFAQQQVIFRLRQPAEQRPDDRGMIARRDTEPGMAVDDARAFRRDRDVRQQPGDQAGADRRPLHRRDHRLGAIDDVVDEIARFLPHARQHGKILAHLLDQIEIAAAGERLAGAGDDRTLTLRIGVDVAPDSAPAPDASRHRQS